ncbi:alpha/beta hydrolase family protein [Singulisphaera acidiphila]|uniref:X-Pro dipeptidyl-peptidase (S15 family) n=1 Tax=Singulisphaera acidiphila (strain ATCC BAA-1392 / DSM 18658 / VKM B-2454 / MOB10) TaxID=886293 RepID=L0D7T7_SINAD|nr:alpha/beta hydrolase [Singulisphaera acidiphila]AGA24721.1 X-Pro dipeptidyl-peptidase (S15 family) [Singulisphaera acidiphila DSM 18658]
MRMMNAALWVSAVTLILAGWSAVADEPNRKEQIWEGKLTIGAGIELRMVFHIAKDEAGKFTATFDSPDQGAKGLKVDSVTLDGTHLVMEMKRILGKFEGALNPDGTEAKGTWSQAGNRLPLSLKRVEQVSEARRPQTPMPPFPYKTEDVSYANAAGRVTLAGTLTLPAGPNAFPAVILISGSGAQDRDESLLGHKPFLVLADALTRRGIAVLRADDRGVGGSTGNTMNSNSDDFAGDVLAGIAFLKTRSEIDGSKIGLIGHSEGGLVAPMVAVRSPDVSFIVMMAGTGLPGDEIVPLQARLIGQASLVDAKELARQLDFQKRLLEIARTEPDDKIAEERALAATKDWMAAMTEAERKNAGDLHARIAGQFKTLRSPWFRYFLSYDPRPTLGKVRCPVLAIVGEKDLQVPPKENLAEIETALKQGGNTQFTIKELPGLNHLFQTSTTGAPSEYARIEETIAPSALTLIGDWIFEQTGKKP